METGIIIGGRAGGSTPGPGPPTPGPGSKSCWAGGRLCAMGNAHPSAVKATAAVRIQSDKRIFMMSPLTLRRGLVRKRAGKAWAALHCDVASGPAETSPLSLLSGVDPAGDFPL